MSCDATTTSFCVGGWAPPVPLLDEWVGWFVVLGFGLIFSLFTVALVRGAPGLFGLEDTSEWFNTAGRKTGVGITAAVIVSQWTWAATLLQSSNVAWKYGVSGPYWYAAGATIQILLFSMLAIELKRKAPKAHTFLEIIRVRWGQTAHLVFLVFALLANIIVTAMLLLGGSAVVNSLTGMSIEAACFLIPIGVMFYTLAGGLKATFMASYVHAMLIYLFLLIFIFEIYVGSDKLGSISAVYDNLKVASAANKDLGFLDGNKDDSYVTMTSSGGLIFGIINVVGNFGTVFVDQSYWQSAIAARPSATVKGFIIGGLCWFAIPFSMATSLGLANLALGIQMSVDDAGAGLVPPYTAVRLFNDAGAWMILIQLFMAVTSTGSAELIAVSSLITYDIYGVYINPDADGGKLLFVSRVGVIIFGLVMGVLGVILNALGLNLGWVYLAMGVIIGSAVIPVSCVLMSSQVTSKAAISGAVGGLILGIITWCSVAAGESGEVTVDTLGKDYPMLFGNLVSILSSGLICGIVTYIDPEDYDFEGTRNIAIVDGEEVTYANADETDPEKLTAAYNYAVKYGSILTIILALVVPMILYAAGYVYSKGFFGFWVAIMFIWSLMASGVCIFTPIIEFMSPDEETVAGKVEGDETTKRGPSFE